MDTDKWIKTFSIKDIDNEDAKEFELHNKTMIAIYNIDNNFYATDLFCSHEKVSLCDGFIDGDTVECPLHQGVFKISTGDFVLPYVKNWRDVQPDISHLSAVHWGGLRSAAEIDSEDDRDRLSRLGGFARHALQGRKTSDHHKHERKEQVYYIFYYVTFGF